MTLYFLCFLENCHLIDGLSNNCLLYFLIVLCQTFIKMGLLSSFACSGEFSSLRLHHSRAIMHLMRSAKERVRQVSTKKCTWSVIKTFSFQENCILKHSEILILTGLFNIITSVYSTDVYRMAAMC